MYQKENNDIESSSRSLEVRHHVFVFQLDEFKTKWPTYGTNKIEALYELSRDRSLNVTCYSGACWNWPARKFIFASM